MDPQSMDPMSKSMPTHPAAKGVLVDQYAQIALFDAEGVVHKLETRLS